MFEGRVNIRKRISQIKVIGIHEVKFLEFKEYYKENDSVRAFGGGLYVVTALISSGSRQVGFSRLDVRF